MKTYKPQLLLVVIVIVFSLIFYYVWVQSSRSIFDQVQSSMKDIDSSFNELLHVHIDESHTLSFYTTLNHELGVVSLQKEPLGFKLKTYLNKATLITDKDISWQGIGNPQEDIYLLFGIVRNHDTSQIIIVSERSQSANIIRTNSLSFWYLLTDETIRTPVTLQTFNKDGKLLYETGDLEYWKERV